MTPFKDSFKRFELFLFHAVAHPQRHRPEMGLSVR